MIITWEKNNNGKKAKTTMPNTQKQQIYLEQRNYSYSYENPYKEYIH